MWEMSRWAAGRRSWDSGWERLGRSKRECPGELATVMKLGRGFWNGLASVRQSFGELATAIKLGQGFRKARSVKRKCPGELATAMMLGQWF